MRGRGVEEKDEARREGRGVKSFFFLFPLFEKRREKREKTGRAAAFLSFQARASCSSERCRVSSVGKRGN